MKILTILKNIGLFFLAPFIALAYLFALPMVGLYMVIRLTIEKLTEAPTTTPATKPIM